LVGSGVPKGYGKGHFRGDWHSTGAKRAVCLAWVPIQKAGGRKVVHCWREKRSLGLLTSDGKGLGTKSQKD